MGLGRACHRLFLSSSGHFNTQLGLSITAQKGIKEKVCMSQASPCEHHGAAVEGRKAMPASDVGCRVERDFTWESGETRN